MDFGKELKRHRIINNYSLNDIAKKTGISRQNLSRWERGEVLPNIDFCVQLADFYEISLDELIGRDLNYSYNSKNYINTLNNSGNINFN